MMTRPELGTKCTCTGCQERFYDLNRSPAFCPKCGAQQPPERPRLVRTPGGLGTMLRRRRPLAPAIVADDVEPVDAADLETEADEADDDADDDIDVDPDFDKPAN